MHHNSNISYTFGPSFKAKQDKGQKVKGSKGQKVKGSTSHKHIMPNNLILNLQIYIYE